MNEPNEVFENTVAQLQLIANNGGLVSLSAEEARAVLDELERRSSFERAYRAKEARAVLDELERCSGFERAYKASVCDYDTLVSGVDLDLDEQADLIADLLKQLQQTVDALAHWFPRWGDPEGASSQMMINARAMIARAEAYLEHYWKHTKGVNTNAR